MKPQSSQSTHIDQDLITQIANTIARRGLAMPAVFVLELHKPFATVLHALATFSQPVIDALVGPRFSQRMLPILGSRAAIEALIVEIERYGAAVE